MKFELNYVADKPTDNNRIYLKEDLLNIFNKPDIPVTLFPHKKGIPLKDIIGIANLFSFNNEKIIFKVKPIQKDILDLVKDKQLTTLGMGEIESKNIKNNNDVIIETQNIVKIIELSHLFIVE